MRSRRRFRRPCEHHDLIEIHTSGLTRIICEDCGHISFRFDEDHPVGDPVDVPSQTTVDSPVLVAG